MRSLRDAAKKLEALGVVVLGISHDTVRAQKNFCQAEKLPFDLLSDEKSTVTARYGATRRMLPWPLRVSVLIDDKGIVRHIWKKVDVRKHGKQVIDRVSALQKAQRGKQKK